MRKRKDMHCRCAPLKRVVMSAALMALGAAGAGANPGAMTVSGGWSVLGGPRPVGGSSDGTIAAASLSVENPYGLEGLAVLRCEAGIAAPLFTAGLGWRRLSHPIYREDGLAAAVRAACPIQRVLAGARIEIVQRRAAGFPAERSGSVALLAACRIGETIAVELAVPVHADGPTPPPCRAWSFELLSGPFAATLDRLSPDGVSTEYLLEARWALDSRVTLRSSYGLNAGELTAGLSARLRRAALLFSWSVHPALGLSASAGVERWWLW